MHETASAAERHLLTAQQVQHMLHVDRSTVYRMAEDGRLPAVKVGRQWRFHEQQITALLGPDGTMAAKPTAAPDAVRRTGPRLKVASETLLAVLTVSAELLGVMLVVTDMDGRPITPVVNRCPWFAERADDPEILAACIAEWQSMADDPDCMPHFHTGVHGYQCTRAFIRSGSQLSGMVLAGGIAPPGADTTGLHNLDEIERKRLLRQLPRVAAALSHVGPRPSGRPDEGV